MTWIWSCIKEASVFTVNLEAEKERKCHQRGPNRGYEKQWPETGFQRYKGEQRARNLLGVQAVELKD